MLWVVEQRRLWGDLGSVLVAGSAGRASPDGPLLLDRTGPFLPPISFPWFGPEGRRLVVSDGFRESLERSAMTGLRFRPATFRRIVYLAWERWDLSADEPEVYPPGGEPEGYVTGRPHDPRTAARMPAAWELIPPVVPAALDRLEDPRGGYLDRFRLDGDPVDAPPLFFSRGEYGYLVADDGARDWLEKHAGSWVRFSPVELVGR